ncbi:hypothetical protein J6590_013779 [Homalodisca vitripennis]|nr:hypothetical protein J6590_013779 [Homalodisca vitripennis]
MHLDYGIWFDQFESSERSSRVRRSRSADTVLRSLKQTVRHWLRQALIRRQF